MTLKRELKRPERSDRPIDDSHQRDHQDHDGENGEKNLVEEPKSKDRPEEIKKEGIIKKIWRVIEWPFVKIWHGIKWTLTKIKYVFNFFFGWFFASHKDLKEKGILGRTKYKNYIWYKIELLLLLLVVPFLMYFIRIGDVTGGWRGVQWYFQLFINPYFWVVIPLCFLGPAWMALSNRSERLMAIIESAESAGNKSKAIKKSMLIIKENNSVFYKLKNYIFLPIGSFFVYLHIILLWKIFPQFHIFDFLYEFKNLPGIIIIGFLYILFLVFICILLFKLRIEGIGDGVNIAMTEIGTKYIIREEVSEEGKETAQPMIVEN